MSGCGVAGTVSTTNPFQTVPLGSTYQIPNSCGFSGQKYSSQCADIAGGEFEWSGQGDWCETDSLNPGATLTCPLPLILGCHPCISGKQTVCKRVRYAADPVQCALQGTPNIGNQTCDPQLNNKTSTAYRLAMQGYCTGSHVSEAVCQTFCQQNPNVHCTSAPSTLQACKVDMDCPAGQTCANGQCTLPSCIGTGQSTCPAGKQCIHDICQFSSQRSSTTVSCTGTGQSTCLSGQQCINGACQWSFPSGSAGPSAKKKMEAFPVWAIIVVVFGVFLLVGILLMFLLRRRKTAVAQKSQ